MSESLGPKTTPTGFRQAGGEARRSDPPAATGRPRLTPAELAVRTAYVITRSIWESTRLREVTVYTPPASYDGHGPITVENSLVITPAQPSVWLKLAKWFDQARIDPESYIQLLFSRIEPSDARVPEPKQITAERYVMAWNAHRDDFGRGIASSLVLQLHEISTSIAIWQHVHHRDKHDSYAIALTTTSGTLSPLIRHCVARSIVGEIPNTAAGRIQRDRFAAIAARFRRDAVFQYMQFRHFYRFYWTSVLPPDFDANADKRYAVYIRESEADKN